MTIYGLSHLPIELYLHTLSFIAPSDLASLIRVSKTYQNATEHELYRNIELSGSIDQVNKCLRTLSYGFDSPAGLVQRFSLHLPEDEYKDEDKRQMKDRLFWTRLGAALSLMAKVQEIDLECPHHSEVWAALLSMPKDLLKSLTLIHTENYSRPPAAELDRVYGTPPPSPHFNVQTKFPSLIHLDIHAGFRIDCIHQDFIYSLLWNHAKQLRAMSVVIHNIPRSEGNRLLPNHTRFPNVEIFADLDTAFLEPLLSVQLPNLRTLSFTPMSSSRARVTGEELTGYFENLQTIQASYPILQLFLSSPRTLEHIEMQPALDTKWEDVRTTIKMLTNCSRSLRVLHIDLFLTGAKLKELWSLIPPLPHLETLLIRVAPDWYHFDLREAVSCTLNSNCRTTRV